VTGNISAFSIPDDPALAQYTQQVMRNNNLLGSKQTKLFPGMSPIKHVIYVIKENRTYDQVFGDVARRKWPAADGDPRLAIFGAGEAAQRPDGVAQLSLPTTRPLRSALDFSIVSSPTRRRVPTVTTGPPRRFPATTSTKHTVGNKAGAGR